MKKYIFIILVILLIVCVTIAAVILCDRLGPVTDISAKTKGTTDEKETSEEDFAFSFTWGCYGVSSYDSETGVLIKEKNATYPHKYTTNLMLTEQQLNEISALIEELDIKSYSDRYDPHNGRLHSSPSMTLVLSVKTEDYHKSVTAEDIALGFDECSNRKGRKFLSVCKRIQQIITESEEWKALSDYEFIYS